jgi:hypothetical protein
MSIRGDRIKRLILGNLALVCPICGGEVEGDEEAYPNLICDDCDDRAVGEDGEPAEYGFEYLDREPDSDGGIQMEPETGTNPVCIDGHKAWRRYRVGGWGTMVDEHDCASLEECYEAHGLME